MANDRLIAIGDVHGCIHALDALLEAIAPAADDRIVFLGDLVDQGPNSCEVLERIIDLQSRTKITLIRGNHEEMMLAARKDEPALRFWENCGGVATLSSYRFGAKLSEVPDAHWELIEASLPYYETEDFIFTHANYDPELRMAEQLGHQLRWALFHPDEMQPHQSGKPVTAGHTEQRNGEILDIGFAACIDTACWRYGWLTAIDRQTGRSWQASKWGLLREQGEATHREPLTQLLRKPVEG